MARILVIDDENNIRMMVRIALEQSGHEVDTAEDGRSGLAKFGDGSKYDLVLLDQRMPGMEGLDVLREMKTLNPSARIVMITAFGTIDLAVDAMKAGATDFLRKPFTTETLRGAVIGALMADARPPTPQSEPTETEDAPISSAILYGLSTVNGFHIQSDPKSVVVEGGEMRCTFVVRHPSGEEKECTVTIPERIVTEIKATVHGGVLPGDDRFWHGVCEHVLANHLYQHADYPPEFHLQVVEFDKSLRNLVKASFGTNY